MEDPWGSPWAADSAAKIELPAAPQNAHFSADHLFPRRGSRSPARSRSPGWEDDDAWGGWNGGAAAGHDGGGGGGKESPGWGRSPGLKPMRVAPSARSLSPDPWKEAALQRLDTAAPEDDGGKPGARRASETLRGGRVADSAISLGEDQELQREESSEAPPLDIVAADDAWRVGVTPEAPAAEAMVPAIQLEQPDLPPGAEGPVLDAGHDREQDGPLLTADELVRREDETPTPLSVEAGVVTEPQHQRQEAHDEVPEPPPDAETKEDRGTQAAAFQPESGRHPASRAPKYSVVSYPIDLAMLDDLFPSTPAVTTEAELVPDVVIDDTFASSSERKAWYRISRFGSMRKHDLGGDENYVRVSWSASQVRERTTQTVRRWMEEDSIAGRVVLGRRLGGSGAVMFNWNSPAPQVEIGEFLGRHSRNSSLTVKSAAPSPTASSFGWAGSVPSSPAVARHPLANEIEHADAQGAQSPKEPKADPARQSLSLEPPPAHARAHIPAPIKIPPTLGMNQDEDDGDDWGEMVTATPTDAVPRADGEGTASNRHSIPHNIPPLSAFQFDTVFESPKLAPPKMDKAPSKRPLSWHLGQTLSKPFKRGIKSPLTPLFPSPLSKPMTPPQAAPVRPTQAMSAGASPVQSSPVRSSLSAEDEETVARLLGDIPDLTYMLR
ncbi:hypothetical protein Trco_001302 [Trichoderma cornu-damae]|uniref:Uncharacterized protein n=1 Tax=Trichoderma cornu-damae TaxID=654480 RepID=A0A9P8QYN6_9HYPO|nr:hypothetical protein Trco_001302 [Trichoderma cornu-damae]